MTQLTRQLRVMSEDTQSERLTPAIAYAQPSRMNTFELAPALSSRLRQKPAIISERSLNQTERSLDKNSRVSSLNKDLQFQESLHAAVIETQPQTANKPIPLYRKQLEQKMGQVRKDFIKAVADERERSLLQRLIGEQT